MAMSQRMWKQQQERRRKERQRRQRRRRNCALIVILFAIAAVMFVFANAGKDGGDKPEATQLPLPQTENIIENAYTTTVSQSDISTSFYKNSAFAGNALAQTIEMYSILDEADFYTDINADLENVYTLTPNGSTVSISDQFKSKKFKKVFLVFGENELKWESSSKFKTYYADFVEKIKEYQPNAVIYLLAIPPVTEEVATSDGYISKTLIKEYNKRIKSIAVSEDIYYIDSFDALRDNRGLLPEGISSDGISLNKAAALELLKYAQDDAYIPEDADLAADEERTVQDEDEQEEEPERTKKPEASPEPTVNVLKTTASDKKQNGED